MRTDCHRERKSPHCLLVLPFSFARPAERRGITTGVPRIADEILHGAKSAASGQELTSSALPIPAIVDISQFQFVLRAEPTQQVSLAKSYP
jgi:hypothetical protein